MPLQACGPASELALNPLRHRYTLFWERDISLPHHTHTRTHTDTHTRRKKDNNHTSTADSLFSHRRSHTTVPLSFLSPHCSQFQVYTVETSCGFLLFSFRARSFPPSSLFFHLLMWWLPFQNHLPVCRQLTASFTFLCQFLLLPLSLSVSLALFFIYPPLHLLSLLFAWPLSHPNLIMRNAVWPWPPSAL